MRKLWKGKIIAKTIQFTYARFLPVIFCVEALGLIRAFIMSLSMKLIRKR